MRKRAWVMMGCLLVTPVGALASFFGDDAPPPPVCGAGVAFDTAFSPKDDVTHLVVQQIAGAKASIRMAAHSFVSKPVSEALIAAKRAGRNVQVVLDKESNQNGYSNATFLQLMGNPPRMTRNTTRLYQNYLLIDDRDVIVGDVTSAADAQEEQKNFTGVLVIHNAPDLVKRYLASWQALWDGSEEMKPQK